MHHLLPKLIHPTLPRRRGEELRMLRRWIYRSLKLASLIALLVVLCGACWWWTRPTLEARDLHVVSEGVLATKYDDVAGEATGMVRQVATDLRLPSVSIAVGVDGDLVWSAAIGLSDVAGRNATTPQTRYRTGSVAKPMTGVVLAQLIIDGRLDPDVGVRQYLPGYPGKRWDPTPRQLASHTGGVRHYSEIGHPSFVAEQFSKQHYASVTDALQLFRDDPLEFEPETNFLYSTHGFTLLSATMEAAAGRPFETLMNELWSDREMTRTTFDDFIRPPRGRATPYVVMRNRAVHVEGPDPSYKWAGGGMLSTPEDLVRLGSSLFDRGYVRVDRRHELFEPRPLADGSENPQRYAMGWRNDTQTDLLKSSEPLAVLHHGGQCPGGSSFLLVVPNGKVVAATMTNASIRDPWPLREATYRIAGMFRQASLAKPSTDSRHD